MFCHHSGSRLFLLLRCNGPLASPPPPDMRAWHVELPLLCPPLPSISPAAVTTVVHLSPLEVLRLPSYKQWLASFGEGATHVLVAESLAAPTPVMRKSAIVQVGGQGAWCLGWAWARRDHAYGQSPSCMASCCTIPHMQAQPMPALCPF